MRYVSARFDEDRRADAYRFYISKSLQLVPQGAWIEKSFRDILEPQVEKTGEEIVIDVITNAGLRFKG